MCYANEMEVWVCKARWGLGRVEEQRAERWKGRRRMKGGEIKRKEMKGRRGKKMRGKEGKGKVKRGMARGWRKGGRGKKIE